MAVRLLVAAILLVRAARAIVNAPPATTVAPTTNFTDPSTAHAFNLTNLPNITFAVPHASFPTHLCPYVNLTYTRVLPMGRGTFRLPHSAILVDGAQCGNLPLNATDDQLYVDAAMELVPLAYLQSEELAERHDAKAVYRRLWGRRPFARTFFNFSTGQVAHANGSHTPIYVGLERFRPRVCANRTVLPFDSFVFMGAFDNIRLNIAAFLPHSTSLRLPVALPFHLSFALAPASDPASYPERVCPARQLVDPEPRSLEYRLCFPARAVVHTPNGPASVGRLRLGDRVLDPAARFSSVFLFSHRRPGARTRFIAVDAANRTLTLSAGHFVHTPGGLVAARALRRGDVVRLSSNASARVDAVRTVRRTGLYNPHTLSGWMIVDGVAVSCYTDALPPFAAHALLAPVRALFRVGGPLSVRPVMRVVVTVAHVLEGKPRWLRSRIRAKGRRESRRTGHDMRDAVRVQSCCR